MYAGAGTGSETKPWPAASEAVPKKQRHASAANNKASTSNFVE